MCVCVMYESMCMLIDTYLHKSKEKIANACLNMRQQHRWQ